MTNQTIMQTPYLHPQRHSPNPSKICLALMLAHSCHHIHTQYTPTTPTHPHHHIQPQQLPNQTPSTFSFNTPQPNDPKSQAYNIEAICGIRLDYKQTKSPNKNICTYVIGKASWTQHTPRNLKKISFARHEDYGPSHNTQLLTKHYTRITHDHLHKIHHKHYLQPKTKDTCFIEKPIHIPHIHLNTHKMEPQHGYNHHNTHPPHHFLYSTLPHIHMLHPP